MTVVPAKTWDSWSPPKQEAAELAGLIPAPDPWMDEAYEALTGVAPRGVKTAEAGQEDGR